MSEEERLAKLEKAVTKLTITLLEIETVIVSKVNSIDNNDAKTMLLDIKDKIRRNITY